MQHRLVVRTLGECMRKVAAVAEAITKPRKTKRCASTPAEHGAGVSRGVTRRWMKIGHLADVYLSEGVRAGWLI